MTRPRTREARERALVKEFEHAAKAQLKLGLLRAGLPVSTRLSTDQTMRALVWPRGLRGQRLANWILHGEPVTVRFGDRIAPDKAQSTTHKEGTMATKVKVKSSAKKGAAAKKGGTAAKKATPAKASNSTRRTAADIDKLVPKFKSHLTGGGTMKALKAEHGFSSDVPIREALARAGYDSKGKKLTIEEITGSGKKLATAVAKERRGGEAWYILALRTGKSESELKSLLAEHGFDEEASGRAYKSAGR